MKRAIEKLNFKELPKTYMELVKLHVPRPISDKASYENTLAIVDALAGHDLNRDQEDYLEILGDLVASYDRETLPDLPNATGIELLQFLLEENDLTGDDLARVLDVDRSTAYRILKGKRKLTTDHIRSLCARFSVQADLFLRV